MWRAFSFRFEILAKASLGAWLGMLAAGSLALVLSDHAPWPVVYAFLGVLQLGCVAFTLAAPVAYAASTVLARNASGEPMPSRAKA